MSANYSINSSRFARGLSQSRFLRSPAGRHMTPLACFVEISSHGPPVTKPASVVMRRWKPDTPVSHDTHTHTHPQRYTFSTWPRPLYLPCFGLLLPPTPIPDSGKPRYQNLTFTRDASRFRGPKIVSGLPVRSSARTCPWRTSSFHTKCMPSSLGTPNCECEHECLFVEICLVIGWQPVRPIAHRMDS